MSGSATAMTNDSARPAMRVADSWATELASTVEAFIRDCGPRIMRPHSRDSSVDGLSRSSHIAIKDLFIRVARTRSREPASPLEHESRCRGRIRREHLKRDVWRDLNLGEVAARPPT